jgi:hypothetical protein
MATRPPSKSTKPTAIRSESLGVSIAAFVAAIESLPEDEPNNRTDVWYENQKMHWLGYLDMVYGESEGGGRDARFVYNHVVNPYMLLWLVEAAGVRKELVTAAQQSAKAGATLMQKAGAVRKQVPWTELASTLWPA